MNRSRDPIGLRGSNRRRDRLQLARIALLGDHSIPESAPAGTPSFRSSFNPLQGPLAASSGERSQSTRSRRSDRLRSADPDTPGSCPLALEIREAGSRTIEAHVAGEHRRSRHLPHPGHLRPGPHRAQGWGTAPSGAVGFFQARDPQERTRPAATAVPSRPRSRWISLVKTCLTGEPADTMRDEAKRIVPDAEVVRIHADGRFDADPEGEGPSSRFRVS